MLFQPSLLLFVGLSLLHNVQALPSVTTDTLDLDARLAAASHTIEWLGPIVVGGPNVTITGDVVTITDQILHLNPNYFEDGLGGSAEGAPAANRAQSVISDPRRLFNGLEAYQK